MCGIVGVFGDSLGITETSVFDKLLVLSSFRGEHSTGLVRMSQLTDSDDIRYRSSRSLMPSPRLVYTKEYDSFVMPKWDDAKKTKSEYLYGLIGHTRHATKGSITIPNTHPFTFDNIIGVHNGTIKKNFQGTKDYETDSEAFYALLKETGNITEALNEVQDFDSAYAFVWVDKETNKVHFVKNDKRPLYFTFAFQGRSMYMASTREMLEFVCKGKTTHNHEKKFDTPYFTLTTNHMMTIDIGESPLESMEMTKLEVEQPKSYYYRAGAYSNFSGGGATTVTTYSPTGATTNTGKHQPTQTGSSHGSNGKSSDARPADGEQLRRLGWLNPTSPSAPAGTRLVVAHALPNEPDLFYRNINGVDFAKGFEGKFYRVSELQHHLAQGCLVCGSKVELYSPEFKKIVWYDRGKYICPDCIDLDWVQVMLEEERKSA